MDNFIQCAAKLRTRHRAEHEKYWLHNFDLDILYAYCGHVLLSFWCVAGAQVFKVWSVSGADRGNSLAMFLEVVFWHVFIVLVCG